MNLPVSVNISLLLPCIRTIALVVLKTEIIKLVRDINVFRNGVRTEGVR